MNILQALWAAIQCKPIRPRACRPNRNSGANNPIQRNISGLRGTVTENPSARGSKGDEFERDPTTGNRPAVSIVMTSDQTPSSCTANSTKVDTVSVFLESGVAELDASTRSSFSSLRGSLPSVAENLVTSSYCSQVNGPVSLESIIEKNTSDDKGEVDRHPSDQQMSIAFGEQNTCSMNQKDEEIGMLLKDED